MPNSFILKESRNHRQREAGINFNSLYSGTSSVTTGPEDVYQEAGIDYSDKDPGL